VTYHDNAPAVVTQAYSFALDPTAEQVSMLRSHVGGSRFAYNALLGLVKANWDENRAKKDAGLEVTNEDYVSTSHFGLLYLWADHRDELAPWWRENGSSTYNDAAQRLAASFANFRKGRAEFPHFKRRGQGGSVRFHRSCRSTRRLAPRTHRSSRRYQDLRVHPQAFSSPRPGNGQDRGRHGVRAFGKMESVVHSRGHQGSPRAT
jgi:transposase